MLALYRGRSFRRDPDVYGALLDLYQQGSKNLGDSQTFIVLSALSRIDIDRAEPILKERVQTSGDAYTFNRISSIVSAANSREALELMFRRYQDLMASPVTRLGNPSIGIDKIVVIRYLEEAEDAKLETALDVLYSIGGHPPLSRAVLIRKLASPSPRSRKAAVGYIKREMGRGAFTDQEMISTIDGLSKNEKDPSVAEMERQLVDGFGAGRPTSR